VLADRTARSTTTAAGRLDRAGTRLGLVASQRLRDADRAATDAAEDVTTRAERVLAGAASGLDTAAATVRALDPVRALARGWTITRDADGQVVRGVAHARAAGTLRTTFADGTVDSHVESAPRSPEPDEEHHDG
jgi:exodeoxyribonuclease VII large subunit